MPFLEFHNVSLRVGHVDQSQAAGTGDINGDQITVVITAQVFDLFTFRVEIINLESKVSKSRAVQWAGIILAVLGTSKNFNGGAIRAVARDT